LPAKDKIPDRLLDTLLKNRLQTIGIAAYSIDGADGKEFASHQEIARTLRANFYFAHPYTHHGNEDLTKTRTD